MEYLRRNEVAIGDVRELAGRLEPQSIQCLITSPPYFGLRSYLDNGHADKGKELGSEATPAEFVANLVAVFAALRDCLKDNGCLWLNLGDSFGPNKCLYGMPWRVAFALIDDGWILRSAITWAKTAPMPESCTDRPTSATEMIFLFAKRPTYFYDQAAVAEKATSALPIVAKPRSQNRHPDAARLEDRPVDNWGSLGYGAGGTRNMRNFWLLGPENFPGAHFAVFPSEIPRRAILSSTSAAGECSACGKAWARVVERTFRPMTDRSAAKLAKGSGAKGLDASSRWDDTPRGYTDSTTTGWAPQCSCPPGTPTRPQTVLDPFGGSGTVAEVAHALGRDWLLLDLDERAIGWTNGRLAKMPVGTLC